MLFSAVERPRSLPAWWVYAALVLAGGVISFLCARYPAELPAYKAMFNLFANAKGASSAVPVVGGGCGDWDAGNSYAGDEPW